MTQGRADEYFRNSEAGAVHRAAPPAHSAATSAGSTRTAEYLNSGILP
jgi:hypothetical protein